MVELAVNVAAFLLLAFVVLFILGAIIGLIPDALPESEAAQIARIRQEREGRMVLKVFGVIGLLIFLCAHFNI